jgi:pyridoxamine 5'-phosphate oxidase
MTLATSTKGGKPSARIVLLKNVDEEGFVFFTNYGSRKGRELLKNPVAALVFHWVELERQVRIIGSAKKVSREESAQYFRTRPIGSQLGAWASKQSEILQSRQQIEKRVLELETEYANKEIPVPPLWGGFRIKPTEIEFWQGRPNRLHDRLRYSLTRGGKWRIERLSP